MKMIRSKKTRKMMAMLMSAVTLTGCGTSYIHKVKQDPKASGEAKQQIEETDFQETVLTEQEVLTQEQEFSKGINQFSYEIFGKLNNEENIFLSPYSMAMAFSMLANGADGETKREIMQLFGIRDLDKRNAYVKEYTNKYQKGDTKLLTANSLWLSDRLNLSPKAESEFFSPLSAYYHAEKKQTDLSSDATRKEINQWVSENTNDMINSLLTENLEEAVRMVLVNAVYFAGDWDLEFKKEDTEKLMCNSLNPKTETDFMCKYGEEFKYIKKSGIQGLELPYSGNELAMDILIPENKKNEDAAMPEVSDVRELFCKLSQKEKDEIFAAFDKASKKKINQLKIPKFTMEYSLENMKDSLAEMGLSGVFETGADFHKIAEDIYVDKVTHKSKIKVDEKGTEAAAVTAIAMEDNCVEIIEQINFIVDQPFIFVIRDIQTGTILFIGYLFNV